MSTFRSYRQVIVACVFAVGSFVAGIRAEPVAGDASVKPNGDAVKTVVFTITQTRFIADGKEHGPNIVASPADAALTVVGTAKATKPGMYRFTASATGKYSGAVTCNWRIDAPMGARPLASLIKAQAQGPSREVDVEIRDASGKRVHHAVLTVVGNQAGRAWISKPTDSVKTEAIAFSSGAATTVMYVVHATTPPNDFTETRYGTTFDGDSHQFKAGEATIIVHLLPPVN